MDLEDKAHFDALTGITTGQAKHMQTGGDYIKRADAVLYQSKQNGRNQYTFTNYEEDKQ